MHNFFYYLNKCKFFPFYLVSPNPYAIGTASRHIYIGLLKAIERKKILLIFVPTIFQKILKYSICNRCLFNNLSFNSYSTKHYKFIKFFIRVILNIFFLFRRLAAIFFKNFLKIKLHENYFFLEIGIKEDDIEYNKNKDFPILPYNFSLIKSIEIDTKEETFSKKILNDLNVDVNQQFVCLHVRDNIYRGDLNRRNFRNSNIENYYELISYLIQKNFIIFRMGKSARKKIGINHKNLIDLPFLNTNYDFLDLYLIKNCKFFIGTQSGILDTAFLFKKDCLITNVVRLFETPPKTIKSRALCKIPYFKNTNKILNLHQYLNLPYKFHHELYINDELDFIENSDEDLYECIKEFLILIEKRESEIILKENENLFNNYLLIRFYDMFKNDKDLINHAQKVELFRLLKSLKGAYSSVFLNKYFK